MLYPLFLLLIFLSKSNLSKSEADMRSTVISALEKATYFMENTYRDINLDAVVGFRILQGTVIQIASKNIRLGLM